MKENILSSTMGRFRVISFIEGISYVVLLFIAMPLKYMYGFPLAVKITGSAHGFLFVLFMLLLAQVKIEYDWNLKKSIKAFIASLIPFGTFFLEAELRKEKV